MGLGFGQAFGLGWVSLRLALQMERRGDHASLAWAGFGLGLCWLGLLSLAWIGKEHEYIMPLQDMLDKLWFVKQNLNSDSKK